MNVLAIIVVLVAAFALEYACPGCISNPVGELILCLVCILLLKGC